jgi:hypothetical protein
MAEVMEPDLSHARTFQQTEESQMAPVLMEWPSLLVAKPPRLESRSSLSPEALSSFTGKPTVIRGLPFLVD